MADADCTRQLQLLLNLLQQESRRELWLHLNLRVLAFSDLGLRRNASDRTMWRKCQSNQLILVTANRNAKGQDSLEATIRQLNTPDSLPVITLANARRLMHGKKYAERAANKLLEYLFDIDVHRGSGRLYIP